MHGRPSPRHLALAPTVPCSRFPGSGPRSRDTTAVPSRSPGQPRGAPTRGQGRWPVRSGELAEEEPGGEAHEEYAEGPAGPVGGDVLRGLGTQ